MKEAEINLPKGNAISWHLAGAWLQHLQEWWIGHTKIFKSAETKMRDMKVLKGIIEPTCNHDWKSSLLCSEKE